MRKKIHSGLAVIAMVGVFLAVVFMTELTYRLCVEQGMYESGFKGFGAYIGDIWPKLLLLLALLSLAIFILAGYLAADIMEPIERLAGEQEEEGEAAQYEELLPIFDKMQTQHLEMVKNARMRQDFTANVTHELKTPLTSISGYAELIESGMASADDTVRFAAGIRKSANRLLNLINDIIRLSELDDEDSPVMVERLNLHQLAETCVDMLSVNAEKNNVSIHLEGEEVYMYANRQMMEELLYNLCDNAIRYNNVGGSVTMEVRLREGKPLLVVSDTGIGIPAEHQARIFERFYRVDKSRSKSTGGTGLGLAIVKHIIAKHHASIELESEPGKGTRITVLFTGKAE